MVSAMTTVWSSIFEWLIDAIGDVIPIFWDATANSGAGALTLLGTLAIIALGISIFFLIMGLVQRFIHLAG